MIKNLPANTGDVREAGSIPGSRKFPSGGHSNQFQYSCLENPHGQRSLVSYNPWGPKESDMTQVTLHTQRENNIYQVSRSVPSVGQRATLGFATGKNSGQSKFFKKRE